MTTDSTEQVGRLEKALEAIYRVEPLEKKIRIAKKAGIISGSNRTALLQSALQRGIIDDDQASQLQNADQLRLDVIHVDAFHPDELKTGLKQELLHNLHPDAA